MTVLVDKAVWPWEGRLWAHLVSDVSYAELHEAARIIGKRRLGFQGDHYDVDEADRVRALANGAESVDSRVLVKRLRDAGLRRHGSKPSWVRLAEWPAGSTVDDPLGVLEPHGDPGLRLAAGLESFGEYLTAVGVALFSDDERLAALIEVAPATLIDDVHPGVIDEVVIGCARVAGDRSIELFVVK